MVSNTHAKKNTGVDDVVKAVKGLGNDLAAFIGSKPAVSAYAVA